MFPTTKPTNTICTSLFSWPCPLQPQGPSPNPHTPPKKHRTTTRGPHSKWLDCNCCARTFQRAEGCAVLLPDAIGRGKERVLAVPLSLWPCPLHSLPQHATARTVKLATSNRTVQVLPPIPFRRGIERQPAIHKNGWFVTATRMFQRAEGCAVLLLNTGIGRGKERVPAVSLSLCE